MNKEYTQRFPLKLKRSPLITFFNSDDDDQQTRGGDVRQPPQLFLQSDEDDDDEVSFLSCTRSSDQVLRLIRTEIQ